MRRPTGYPERRDGTCRENLNGSFSRDLEYTGSGKEPDKETVYANGLENLKEAECKGYRTLLQESREVWEAIWKKQDIVIDSREDDAQVAVRFALYHLQIMVRKEDNRVGIGAKALSGEGYKGHSFWDTETFISRISRWQSRKWQGHFWNSVIRDCMAQERKQKRTAIKEQCIHGKLRGQ